MKRKRFFTWILILSGSLFSIKCSTVDVRNEQACPMFGDLHLDVSGKKNLTVEGYSGIVTVPADETTKAKAIDNKEALNAFMASYKSICRQEPPFYNEIAYVRRMKVETESKKEDEMRIETEKKKQETVARQKARKQTGLNLDALDAAIDSWLLLEREANELYTAGQTIKYKKKQSEVEQVWKKIEKIFRIGQSISGTSECPFERIKGVSLIGEEGYATRQFRLSCYDSKNESFNLLFEFGVRDDFASIWDEKVQTKDSIVEIFEAGSRFAGTIQVVGNWLAGGGPKAVELLDKTPEFRVRGDYETKLSEILVKVKIVSLQPVH